MPEITTDIIVRDAVATDLNALRRLYRQLHPDDTTSVDELAAALHALQESSCARVRVASRHGQVVGTVTLYILPNLTRNGRPGGILENIVVDHACRREGIGAILLRDAERIAASRGCYKLALSSADHRLDAHRFYETHGYARHGISYRRIPTDPDAEASG